MTERQIVPNRTNKITYKHLHCRPLPILTNNIVPIQGDSTALYNALATKTRPLQTLKFRDCQSYMPQNECQISTILCQSLRFLTKILLLMQATSCGQGKETRRQLHHLFEKGHQNRSLGTLWKENHKLDRFYIITQRLCCSSAPGV